MVASWLNQYLVVHVLTLAPEEFTPYSLSLIYVL